MCESESAKEAMQSSETEGITVRRGGSTNLKGIDWRRNTGEADRIDEIQRVPVYTS